jgi:futalosine hydrolase
MKLLIIAATIDEIAIFAAENKTVDVLITGVGLPAALYHLQKKIQHTAYDLIIQAGFAGSFTNDLKAGETVTVQQDAFGDLGMEENNNFQPVFETALANKNEFPFTEGWLINNNTLLSSLPYKKVKAITVNTVSDANLLKQQRETAFSPEIETMEGAALHYICLQEKIPFLQLRSISNTVGERDKLKWTMKEAAENLNAALNQLLNLLTNNP